MLYRGELARIFLVVFSQKVMYFIASMHLNPKTYNMRTFIVLLFTLFPFYNSFSQQTDSSEILLNQGIALHDNKDYEGAIKIYDEIIKRDPGYYMAWYEKSLSLLTMGKNQECVDISKQILNQFPNHRDIRKVYVNYGSALDVLGRPDEAIAIYSEGIKKIPGFYLLYFNRGITEYAQKDIESAVSDFKQSVGLNPFHASSHQYLAYSVYNKNKIAAVMSLSTFLLIEPEGARAEKNLKILLKLLSSNVEQKDEKNITINLSPQVLDTKQQGEDDFHMAELTISLQTANDFGEKSKGLNDVEKLKGKLETLAIISTETKKSKQGFFSRFYIPFLKQMKDHNYLEIASYIMYSAGGDEALNKWLKENQAKVEDFYKWLKAYQWAKEE